ncbi:hypothetical protein WA026_006055 [Henosepilachna vigintioctopunctata]|uniref:Acyltransferase 3 domain-containing protein n=1 Tax=Henosepilachna vigintioctopunctata TaxID=420089 RepID=A0AAW1TPH5_9CUCU
MFQSWYLTCDTHYFLIVPFLTYLLWRKPKLGFLFCGILTFASLVTHFLTIYLNEEDPFLLLFMKVLRDPVLNKTFKTIYIPSHMRISPYLVGVIGGFVKFQMRSSAFKIAMRNVVFMWVIGLATGFAILFSSFLFYLPTENKDYTLHGFYGSFHHFLWSVCISALIVMVSENHGQWVAPYLNWRPWILLSRITYSAFLCHGGVQLYTSAIQRTPMYVGLFNIFYYAAADIVFAYLLGFCLSLVFESPILELERIILKKQFSTSKNIEETEQSHERKQDLKEVKDIYIPRIQKEISWNSYKL